ncbi:MAG: ABC transporter ATP-binding protein [Firmicutes bacterium]|jgi:multidrug ABC transporter, permease/ATP-binding protein|nr:ABC transporter ATP-binding protein [Bacillota bacterium]
MKQHTFRRILRYLLPKWFLLIFVLLFSTASVLLNLYTTVLIGEGVDYIVGMGDVDFDAIARVAAIFAAAIGGIFIAEYARTTLTNRLAFSVVRKIRLDAVTKLNRVPVRYVDGSSRGDLISRVVTDVSDLSDGLLMGFAQLFTGVVTIVATLVIMFLYRWEIALIVVVMTPLSLFVAYFVAKNTYKHFKAQSETRGEMTSLVEEMVGGQKTVKAFSMEEKLETRFDGINQKLKKAGTKAVFFSAVTNPATRFVNNLVYLVVAVVGAYISIDTAGAFSVGMLLTFLLYANKYTKPFNEISGVVTELQSAFAAANRVLEVVEQPAEEPDEPGALSFTPKGAVEIDGISFSYRPDTELIKDFTLSVPAGSRVAIVGKTGCGKTTFINLLMRFYDVTGGEIRVDGVPVRQMKRDSLRESYGMVLQETWLKRATVRENIAYGNPEASLEEVIAAAKAAHAHSFIKRLPAGYDTVVGDDYGSLSEGQKQLLCIARAMLVRPPMLILDEATSSIDTLTEAKIQAAFEQMMKGRTSFVVAHRLSTIRTADVILVMERGKILEQGTHEALLKKNGAYAALYNSQFGAV